MKKNNKGFTLVELLVVIAIIGILAVVAVPALFKNIEKGKVADLEADISAIRSAALSVYADTSDFPTEGDINANNVLMKELEGLSYPFNGKYEIDNTDDGTKSYLKMTLGQEISTDGISKLIKDLGSKITAPANSNSKTNNIQIELLSR